MEVVALLTPLHGQGGDYQQLARGITLPFLILPEASCHIYPGETGDFLFGHNIIAQGAGVPHLPV